MFTNALRRQFTSASRFACRHYSVEAAVTPSGQPAGASFARTTQYPYYIPRNSTGSLPVYTDYKNAGARCMVLIRNVEGDVNALVRDVRQHLINSEKTVSDMSRLEVEVVRSKHLVLHGARPRMKNEVIEWLKSRGF
jgi:large subunit ribosomal protein L49